MVADRARRELAKLETMQWDEGQPPSNEWVFFLARLLRTPPWVPSELPEGTLMAGSTAPRRRSSPSAFQATSP